MGQNFGAYTFDIAYDNNIFEYVRSEGGTENDNKTRVRVTYYDSTGGTNPRTSMSVTFKAKADIESTNPTDFSITAEGLSNKDASQEYKDITIPIKKSVTVEPNYEDYVIEFNHTGKILPKVEKNMELITKSKMGKNYDHVKMTVQITKKPSDSATVNLFATTRTRQEIDLIKDGWGEPDGYQLGGKDVEQILDIRALFSELGAYTVKISLLDKDNVDAIIVAKDFNFDVVQETTGGNNNENTNQEDENQGTTGGTENNEGSTENNGNTTKPENNEQEQEKLPNTLPQTGTTQYVYIITALAVLSSAYVAIKNIKKDKKN